MTAQELINLIVIPLSLFLASLWITRLFEKRDTKEEKAAEQVKELLEKAAKEKDAITNERWARFSQVQCDIKTKVDKIVDDMHDKVPFDHCNDRMDLLDERIRAIKR